MDLAELTEARAPHVTDRVPARRERFLEELECFLAAPGLRIREPQKPGRRPPHAAPGSRQSQAAFQQRDGSVDIALDDVEAPQGVRRDDAVELVTARLGDPDRLLSKRDGFAELTEIGEGQCEPGARSDENHGWAESEPQHPEPRQRFPDLAGLASPSLSGVPPRARSREARDLRIERVDDPAKQVASLPKVTELMERHAEAVASDRLPRHTRREPLRPH